MSPKPGVRTLVLILIQAALLSLPLHAGGVTFIPTNLTPPGMNPVVPKLTVNYMADHVGLPVFAAVGAGTTYRLESCGRYLRFTLDPYKNSLISTRNDWEMEIAGSSGSASGQFQNPSDIDGD